MPGGTRKGWRGFFLGLCLWLAAAPAFAASSAVILVYHRFGDDRYPTTSVTTEQLKAHIAELTSEQYHVLPLADIIEAFHAGKALPDRTVAITIDDAYESVYRVAFPLLKAAHLPFTLFVATGPVDGGDADFMTWEQIREMMEAGATIGNHTVTHLHMVGMGDDANGKEIAQAEKRIEAETGKAPTLFAYPYGEYGTAEAALAERQGFAATFGQYSGVAEASGGLYTLPRFAMNEHYAEIGRFRLIVNALPIELRDVVPSDPVLATNPPQFGFTILGAVPAMKSLTCYPSNNAAAAELTLLGDRRIEVSLKEPFPKGRSRINCTMPGPDGRWHWFGHPFFVP